MMPPGTTVISLELKGEFMDLLGDARFRTLRMRCLSFEELKAPWLYGYTLERVGRSGPSQHTQGPRGLALQAPASVGYPQVVQ